MALKSLYDCIFLEIGITEIEFFSNLEKYCRALDLIMLHKTEKDCQNITRKEFQIYYI
jgi:hypothetical protein